MERNVIVPVLMVRRVTFYFFLIDESIKHE